MRARLTFSAARRNEPTVSLRRYGVATSPTRVRQKRQIASGSRTVANAAALSAPTLVPEIARTRRASPSSHIAFQTPAW